VPVPDQGKAHRIPPGLIEDLRGLKDLEGL